MIDEKSSKMLTGTKSGDGNTEMHYINPSLSLGLHKNVKNYQFKTQKFPFRNLSSTKLKILDKILGFLRSPRENDFQCVCVCFFLRKLMLPILFHSKFPHLEYFFHVHQHDKGSGNLGSKDIGITLC